MSGNNRDALETTITALEGLGPEHAAIVEHARTLADAIDRAETSDSKTDGEYRQVLKMLLELGKKRDLDAVAALLDGIRDRSKTTAPEGPL